MWTVPSLESSGQAGGAGLEVDLGRLAARRPSAEEGLTATPAGRVDGRLRQLSSAMAPGLVRRPGAGGVRVEAGGAGGLGGGRWAEKGGRRRAGSSR